jgi:hypothetical protein
VCLELEAERIDGHLPVGWEARGGGPIGGFKAVRGRRRETWKVQHVLTICCGFCINLAVCKVAGRGSWGRTLQGGFDGAGFAEVQGQEHLVTLVSSSCSAA